MVFFSLGWSSIPDLIAYLLLVLQYVHYLQRKYSLGSFNLLGHTAPVQAGSLLLLGPFVDYWLTAKRVDAFDYSPTTVVSAATYAPHARFAGVLLCFHGAVDEILSASPIDALSMGGVTCRLVVQFLILLSCTIAVGTNLSQFICIGRFTAVSFQVLGHMKTILVLIMGFIFFGKEGLNLHVVLGMLLAVMGMVWYGNASAKPGGKERRSYSFASDKSQKHGALSDSGEPDDKV